MTAIALQESIANWSHLDKSVRKARCRLELGAASVALAAFALVVVSATFPAAPAHAGGLYVNELSTTSQASARFSRPHIRSPRSTEIDYSRTTECWAATLRVRLGNPADGASTR